VFRNAPRQRLVAFTGVRYRKRYRYPGRRRLDDRQVLNGILFVLTTGIAWQRLPQELGYGSGMTSGRLCVTGSKLVSGKPAAVVAAPWSELLSSG
jgi:transposase